MQCLFTICSIGFAAQDAMTRPYPSVSNGPPTHGVSRVTLAAKPSRSVIQQGSLVCLPYLRPARSVACRAATPQSTKLDSSMIWGDIMMLTATELASERLPKQVTGVLSLTLLAAWIGVGILRAFLTVPTASHVANLSFATGCCCERRLHSKTTAHLEI